MTRKISKEDRDVQAWQFSLLADAIDRQRAATRDADVHYNRRKASVYTLVRHVSRSGMRRVIDFKVLSTDEWMTTLTLVGADVYRYDYDRNGYVVDGRGMDMAFALTDSVMYRLRVWCEANGRQELAEELRDWQSIARYEAL